MLGLALLTVLSNLGLVLRDGLLLGLGAALLEGSEVTLALETSGGDETVVRSAIDKANLSLPLNLGGLGVGLSRFGGNLTSDHWR